MADSLILVGLKSKSGLLTNFLKGGTATSTVPPVQGTDADDLEGSRRRFWYPRTKIIHRFFRRR